MKLNFAWAAAAALAAAAPGAAFAAADVDPYLWLEQTRSSESVAWAAAQSSAAAAAVEKDARYPEIEEAVRAAVLASDRLPAPALSGGYIYNFWQDAEHVRGLWRRATPEEYAAADPEWETLLDLDALADSEKENWVWEGADCLPPDGELCLLRLSRGGKDAVVIREFDIGYGGFPPGGFQLPEAKSDAAWVDRDTLLVGTDYGPGSLTRSGYPRVLKLWTRGTPLASAATVYEGEPEDVGVWPDVEIRPEGTAALVVRAPTFFSNEVFKIQTGLKLRRLPLPEDSDFKGVFAGRALALLRSGWSVDGSSFPAGALVSVSLDTGTAADLVYAPGGRGAVTAVAAARGRLYVNALENVDGRLLAFARGGGGWAGRPVALPDASSIELAAYDPFEDLVYARVESFLAPPTIYSFNATLEGDAVQAARSLPPRFSSAPFVTEQAEAVSRDGTRVPYFLVRARALKRDGSTPTLLYGYGGFEVPETPRYLETLGRVWLERGGAYALANIRGGGEFGPLWHSQATGKGRQKAFDDFEAVAKDLEARKVTSARRLGIQGGSNGGLLVGAAFTQRPELFGAVVCEVPLLDMLRYTKLGAGPSWTAEYGDPDDPAAAAVLAKYSPYQNVKRGVRYPRMLLMASTEDDRVQPGHARKMAAKLEAFGDDALYFENTEGGHGAAANLQERVRERSLEYTFLWQTLDGSGSKRPTP